MSAPLAGAVMITFLAPACMCFPAPGPSTNTPVPYNQTKNRQLSLLGTFQLVGLYETIVSLAIMFMNYIPDHDYH